MTISKEIPDELLKGVERPEDLLGDAGLMSPVLGVGEPDDRLSWKRRGKAPSKVTASRAAVILWTLYSANPSWPFGSDAHAPEALSAGPSPGITPTATFSAKWAGWGDRPGRS